MWCISDSYKTFIIDTFAHFAQKKIYRPLFEKTDFVALIRPHRVEGGHDRKGDITMLETQRKNFDSIT